MKLARVVLLLTLLVFVIELASAQYIDPGTGSYIFQLIIAGIAALFFWWGPIKSSLKRIMKRILRRMDNGG
jgi:uncharacterized membrane protein YphA (DoxX/SURF4 family)